MIEQSSAYESVLEIPADQLQDPTEVLALVNDESIEISVRFDLACGLYWHCYDWHGGQNSERYSIMSARLEYSPGANEYGPEDEASQYVYDCLEVNAS